MDVSCTDISKRSEPPRHTFHPAVGVPKKGEKRTQRLRKTKWEDYIAWQEVLHKNVWMLFLAVSGLI